MQNKLNKVVGIFANHSTLNQVLNNLNAVGFDKSEISVLIKSGHEQVETHLGGDVRTYSAVTYPSVNERLQERVENTDIRDRVEAQHEASVKDPHALVKDATAGGALGLAAGLAALLIPGVGPIFAAGSLAAAVGAMAAGAAMGTTAGAIMGLFKDEGIPEDRVEIYRKAFDDGKGVVIVTPQEIHLNQVQEIFSKYQPEFLEVI